VGHSEIIDTTQALRHWKAMGLDFSRILHRPDVSPAVGRRCIDSQNHNLDGALDHKLITLAQYALRRGEPVVIQTEIRNVNRTVGAMLSYEISKHYGEEGLPDDTIRVDCTGSAGQSFGAFGARGLTFSIKGDANDYFGKGLSGAKLIIRPPQESTFVAEECVLVGNVAFYGATLGEAYIRGLAGERFCVRNSGVKAVVEGIGDHGCEYMTGGRAVILGRTGRNFAAGMSGGVAYVFDEQGDFAETRCNREMVDLDPLTPEDVEILRGMIERHFAYTESAVAGRILADWEASLERFVKVIPVDYKRALALLASEQYAGE